MRVVLLMLLAAMLSGCGYNSIQQKDEAVKAGWSEVLNQYKRRADLIPNLVNTVKGYATHERDVLERVIEARNRARDNTGAVGSQSEDERRLVDATKQLFAVAEAYPQLKASANFLALQQELVDTEDRIAAARRFYNANVRDYNVGRTTFPVMLVAGFGDFPLQDYFEVDDHTVRAVPVVAMTP